MTLKNHMFQNVDRGSPWLLQPLTILLLLASADRTAAEVPQAVLKLQPPWIRVLQEDSVTLKCQGAHGPGNHSTQWLHNGIAIPSQVQPSYTFKAKKNDSGEYRCQTGPSRLSNPVQLHVFSEWLVLQTPQLVFQEGEPIVLRCHGWRNKTVNKVTFYQNGISKKFFNYNTDFCIAQANHSHSGDYYCKGNIGKVTYSSEPVTITVQEPSSNPDDDSLVVTIVAVVTGIVVMATVAIVAAFVYLKRRRRSALPGYPKPGGMGETFPEESGEYSVLYGDSATSHPRLPSGLEPAGSDLSRPMDTEEAAKAEAENTITYSLLMHPEAAEEEADYQNRI
nr:low affinity immunoglobulin gamma Fc region receptor II isoform X2 [Oryctolagus cuniculus]XP_051714398.1 low affinity immunoglobulin gamma Fc region receptor II isoform X2 [Oryctolagus cuniculus]XP_051714399.1 low affinity immunoglobulin gamma Fc region receptor II isoform X2 [Oryctolagus cuniculus]XP_051714400.1 low affinity immunoglobulin gamma Fc region receptor II isoform X2 [Oryctolagus cuniculus]